jgi:hypothetical protein
VVCVNVTEDGAGGCTLSGVTAAWVTFSLTVLSTFCDGSAVLAVVVVVVASGLASVLTSVEAVAPVSVIFDPVVVSMPGIGSVERLTPKEERSVVWP